MMKTFVILCAIFLANITFAAGTGTSIGNGGVGIVENGKLYMLDLFEYSVHDQPTFGQKPMVHWVPKRVNELFPSLGLSANVKRLFSQKLSDLMRWDYDLGVTILGVVDSLDWRIVNSGLVRLDDDKAAMNPSNLVQIAIRQKFVVFIDREKWQLLDDANKVALLFHESLYAMVTNQSAIDVRMFTGYLFTEAFLQSGYSRHILNGINSLPIQGIKKRYDQILFNKDSAETIDGVSHWYTEIKENGKIGLKNFIADNVCGGLRGIVQVIPFTTRYTYDLKEEESMDGLLQVSRSYRVARIMYDVQYLSEGKSYKFKQNSKDCKREVEKIGVELEAYINREFVRYH